jgi:hypothetical protein
MVALTESQQRRFKRNGFLVIEDGVDEELCREARDILWETIPEGRDDPDSWFARDGDHDEILNRTSGSDSASRFSEVEPFERMLREV